MAFRSKSWAKPKSVKGYSQGYGEHRRLCKAACGKNYIDSEIEVAKNLSQSRKSTIYKLFKEPAFSDFCIITSDQRSIQVHRCVLASCSSYFYAVFSSNCMESISRCLRFTDLSYFDILPILAEIYGNEVELNEDNVDELIILADRLDIKHLVRKFTRYRKNHMNSHNVFQVLQFAREFNLIPLAEYTRNVISHSFLEHSHREDFGHLRDEDLEYLLGGQEISCSSELDLVAAICRWADFDFSGRIASAYWLLFSLRYKFPRRNNFNEKKISRYRLKFNSLIDKFFSILDEVDRLLKLSETRDADENLTSLLKDHMKNTARSRCVHTQAGSSLQQQFPGHWLQKQLLPRTPSEVVFLFGGWSGKEPSELIQILNPITYQWSVTSLSLPEMRIYYAAAEVDGIIYIIGGFDNNSRGLKSTWAFDPLAESWTKKQSMHEARCYASSVVFEGEIFVMGGYDDANQQYNNHNNNNEQNGRRFRSVEKFCPRSNRWTKCNEMQNIRSDAAAVICNGLIFCIGGFTGQDIHDSVEFIDPIKLGDRMCATDSRSHWYEAAPMNHRRSGVSCEVAGNLIFAVGGYNGENQLDSIERYHPEFNTWEEVAHMKIPRSNMGLLAINNRIIIVGGYGNDYTTKKCEEFNPYTLKSECIEDLPSPEGCSGIRLVTARSFEVANHYLYPPFTCPLAGPRCSSSSSVNSSPLEIQEDLDNPTDQPGMAARSFG